MSIIERIQKMLCERGSREQVRVPSPCAGTRECKSGSTQSTSAGSASFRMDAEDGEIRYECFLPILDGVVTDAQITWLVWGSWHTASRYALAFTGIAVSAANAEEAINRADASYEEETRAALTA